MNRRRWLRTRKRLASPVPWLLVGHPDQAPGAETVDRLRDAMRSEGPRGVVLPAGTTVEFKGAFASGGRFRRALMDGGTKPFRRALVPSRPRP